MYFADWTHKRGDFDCVQPQTSKIYCDTKFLMSQTVDYEGMIG